MTYSDMQTTGNSTITAMFDSRADAERATARLRDAGFSSSQISMVEGDETAGATPDPDRSKGFWDSLGDFFFPEQDRYTYAEGLSRGGYLVTVTGLQAGQYDNALDILDDEGTIDLEEREQSWRSEGWGGYEASPYAARGTMAGETGADFGVTGAGVAGAAETDARLGAADLGSDDLRGDRLAGEETIPVVEERLRVGKRDTSHGRVRVRAYTVEEPVSESVDLREERVEIERRPVDRPVSDADAFQDRTIEAEEYREEAVISKEARVVEEIGLRKTSDTHQETVSDTVRRTEVEIEDDRDADRGLPRKDI